MGTDIKEGDIVRLKSGGPPMTVGAKMASGGFTCTWFVGQEVKEKIFTPDQLTVEEGESKQK